MCARTTSLPQRCRWRQLKESQLKEKGWPSNTTARGFTQRRLWSIGPKTRTLATIWRRPANEFFATAEEDIPRLDDQAVSGPGERGPHIGSEAPEQGLPYDDATVETPAHEWTNPSSASS